MRLSDCTFLNIENDPSTSHEVTGAYLSEEIGVRESILNFIAVSEHASLSSSSSFFNFLVFLSISPLPLSPLPLSPLSLSHSYHSKENTSINCSIMQVNVKYALKPEK